MGFNSGFKGLMIILTMNLDDWLTVHHSITLVLSPAWCTKFLLIYI